MGHLPVMEALFTSGGDIDRADADGNTPLLLAASRNKTLVVDRLLQLGANASHLNALGGR